MRDELSLFSFFRVLQTWLRTLISVILVEILYFFHFLIFSPTVKTGSLFYVIHLS